MGIDINGARCLLHALNLGVDYSRVMMVGRQSLYVTSGQIDSLLVQFGRPALTQEALGRLGQGGYAEGFFPLLGATEEHSLDASNYEQSTHIHDLNLPIDDSLKGHYTAVFDGGCLEHVFNFPVAIKSCMEMLAVGGHYLSVTPANNFPGHGFWQFSPELYYRVFSPENGFEVVSMLLYEDTLEPVWYSVADPIAIKSRITFVNTSPCYLGVVARKVQNVDIFRSYPQQSDYTALWASGQAWTRPTDEVPNGLASRLVRKSHNLLALLSFLLGMVPRYRRYVYGYPAPFFEPIDLLSPARPK